MYRSLLLALLLSSGGIVGAAGQPQPGKPAAVVAGQSNRVAAENPLLEAVQQAQERDRKGETQEGIRLLLQQLGGPDRLIETVPVDEHSVKALRGLVELTKRAQFRLLGESARKLYPYTMALAERLKPILPAGYFQWELGTLAMDGMNDLTTAARWFTHFRNRSKLGWVAYYRGQLAEARQLFIETNNRMGSAYLAWLQGDRASARRFLVEELADRERKYPNDDWIYLCPPLYALGEIDVEEGDLQSARERFLRCLRIAEKLDAESWRTRPLGDLGTIAHKEGNLAEARERYLEAITLRSRSSPRSRGIAVNLLRLAQVLDESGSRGEAISRAKEAVEMYQRSRGVETPFFRGAYRYLAQLLLEEGKLQEAQQYLDLARRKLEAVESVPRADAAPVEMTRPVAPVVRFLKPAAGAEIQGDQVELQVLLLAPIPLARYRVWVNGRSLGPAGGYTVPGADEKGRLLDKGRLLEKGDPLGEGRVFEKGRLLEKGADREALAKELPPELAGLARQPQYSHSLLIRHTVPVEDTDGQFLRIAVQGETTGGTRSDRQILRLRRPEAELTRGTLRVLSIGVGAYEHLPKLKYAAADAVALESVLRAQAGMRDDHRLYRGADTHTLVDSGATLARMREELDRLAANTRPGDTVVLALSGHGIKAGNETYFAPVRFDPENASGTGLPWKEVLEKLGEARKVARAVWILADCCRAAPGLRRSASGDATRKGEVVAANAGDLKRGVEEGGNLIVVAASAGDAASYESENLKHGIFTQAWLEALRGEAPDIVYDQAARGKVLALSGLQFWLDTSIRKHAAKAGVRQMVEFPRLEGSFSPSTPVFVPVEPAGR